MAPHRRRDPALGARIHPHYGVFSPVRGEYVQMVADAPLPKDASLAFDIGVGTGVLSAVLAKRGVKRVIATDQDQRALSCARENLARLGLDQQVELQVADLFPEGRAPLVVCNPPWVPARPSSPIEYAVYDPDSRMLRGFLNGLAGPPGAGRRRLADPVRPGRAPGPAPARATAGMDRRRRPESHRPHRRAPGPPRASDATDPLHAARAAEVTRCGN
jgi:methylase of polypeptide subunit release factors